ncbi:hypothetical protein EIN_523860 [Entamoeba invadens IP1]|uniref:Uncharacterized protein n=1 Tax=Entamoeba invadens IP1 TaxID=370355 RepID=A0A0A1UGB0_ENTIV|nr:hypothetical protein EIN_523860 [Entamoeba invadens IP1]ELP92488.1 hypothetical protein EIN_523860 [Entamoeba invadens IP1]|eukprot:XP_004259259.1 hypothetical protein EIN_523860 [Entamoeba invadens IP1]
MATEARRYIDQRNTSTYLECTLLALLSNECSVHFSRPQKSTKYSHQFLKVSKLTLYQSEVWQLEVSSLVKRRCKEMENVYILKGASQKTALRRALNKKRRETMHILEDILYEEGYSVSYKGENREGIYGEMSVVFPNGIILNNDRIERLGKLVWEHVNGHMGERGVVVKQFELTGFVDTICNELF